MNELCISPFCRFEVKKTILTFCVWCKLFFEWILGDWGVDPGCFMTWLEETLGIGGGNSKGGGGGKISDQFGT